MLYAAEAGSARALGGPVAVSDVGAAARPHKQWEMDEKRRKVLKAGGDHKSSQRGPNAVIVINYIKLYTFRFRNEL